MRDFRVHHSRAFGINRLFVRFFDGDRIICVIEKDKNGISTSVKFEAFILSYPLGSEEADLQDHVQNVINYVLKQAPDAVFSAKDCVFDASFPVGGGKAVETMKKIFKDYGVEVDETDRLFYLDSTWWNKIRNETMKNVTKHFLIGQMYALFESVGAVNAEDVAKVATCPGRYFGACMSKATASPEYKTIEKDVSRVLARMNVGDVTNDELDETEQGQFLLGYHKKKLPVRLGAPYLENRVDWDTVDFSKEDAVLSRELGVARQTIWKQRRKRGLI